MSGKKKILVVINTMGRAGAEKSLIELLKAFDYSRVSVSLLSIIGRGELFAEVPEQVRTLNYKPSPKPVLGVRGALYIALRLMTQMFRSGGIFKFIPYAVKNISGQLKARRFQLDKLLWLLLAETAPVIDEEFDLGVAFIEGASTYYVADKVKAKYKLSVNHVNYQKAGYVKQLDFKYYQKMDYICCVSESIKEVLKKEVFPELSDRMRIFPNIIRPDEIRSRAKQPGGFHDGEFHGLRILSVGRLHPQKGFDVAIAAFSRLVHDESYGHVKWYVIGDGTEKARLRKLIAKYGLNDNFLLLGSRSNPYPYMAQCDIYVQPSRYEGLGLTLQEALILNKPCITTRFDGIPDMLTDGKDALVIDFSEESIRNSIGTLIRNEELRNNIANAAKNLAFDFPNKTNVLYDIINDKKWIE